MSNNAAPIETTPRTLFVAGDHAGFALKKALMEQNPELPWEDLGTFDENSVDYPDYAQRIAEKLRDHKDDPKVLGVLICGSGQGVAMAANRHPHIRAALCWNADIARLSRQHNNANVLCMGARFVDLATAQETLNAFLTTPFEGGRHERRVAKLSSQC